ncbi:Thioredoxin-like 2, chloroplastic, partial [Tetrabaena socialis]
DVNSIQELVDELADAGDRLVIVEYYAQWCNACRALFPKICRMVAEQPDVLFLKVNFDDNRDACRTLGVKVLPYFHFYRGAEGRVAAFSCTISKLQLFKHHHAANGPHHHGWRRQLDAMPYGSGAASDARLAAIRRHLSAILPAEQLQRFWQEGFAAERQPTFRLNSLRLAVAAAGGGVGGSGASGDSDSDAGGSGGGGNGGGGGGSSGGGGGGHGGSAAVSGGDTGGGQSPGTTAAGGATPASAAAVVRRLLSGFGLPADTPVESCPYYPRAHLLPPAAAASVRVAQHAATLEPLQVGASWKGYGRWVQSGAAYFQSLSSMLPALALMASPQPPPGCDHGTATEGCAVHDGGGGGDAGADGGGGDGGGGGGLRVLDLCAAPGGKTALLAELMGNRGTLLAVDASWPRMQRLQYNLNRLVPDAPNGPQQTERRGAAAGPVGGATGGALWRRGCVAAAHTDGTTLQVDERGLPVLLLPRKTGAVRQHGHGNAFPPGRTAGVYDRVLVDAPCSGLGRLQLRRPASYSHWLADDGGGGGGGSGGDGGRHSARQQRLLASAVRLLRRGGSLVYSTCTVDPRENEMVLQQRRNLAGVRVAGHIAAGPATDPTAPATLADVRCPGPAAACMWDALETYSSAFCSLQPAPGLAEFPNLTPHPELHPEAAAAAAAAAAAEAEPHPDELHPLADTPTLNWDLKEGWADEEAGSEECKVVVLQRGMWRDGAGVRCVAAQVEGGMRRKSEAGTYTHQDGLRVKVSLGALGPYNLNRTGPHPHARQVVAWLLGCVGGLRVVEPHLPHPELLPPLHRPQQQPVTHSPPASASVTTAAAVAHPAAAAAALGPVPLRAALEAHRPGCTYAPILDGPAWTQASLERGAGVGRSGGARRPSAAEYGVYDMYGTSGGGGRGGEWLREELGRCVRVVPGPTYEGFFIAQLVKL